jgi:hypothetical protein
MRDTKIRGESEVAIFVRMWERAPGGMTPGIARQILKLGFDDVDRNRIRDLLERNREEGLSPQEAKQLDSYVKAGDLLAILQSRARKLLKVPPPKIRRG